MKHVTYNTAKYKIKAFEIDSEIITEVYYNHKCIYTKTYQSHFEDFNRAVLDTVRTVYASQSDKIKDAIKERKGWERMTAKREKELNETVKEYVCYDLKIFIDDLEELIM